MVNITVMAKNGISGLTTKQLRQVAKLNYSQAKRKGQTITEGSGTWSTNSVDDNTKVAYRSSNTYDINALSLKYNVNALADDSVTYNPLLPKRPWISGGPAPTTVEDAVAEATLDRLQTNYDAEDNLYIKPASLASGGTITQWLDQSVFAHNLNGTGSSRPAWYSGVKNGLGAIRFDGTNDCLDINPVAWLNSLSQATFFIVCKPTATTGDSAMGSDQGDLRIFSDTGAWKVGMAGVTAGQASGTAANITATNWYYMSVIYDGTAATNADRLKFKVNGTDITLSYSGTVGTTTSGSNTRFAVGCNGASAEYFAGDVGEVLVFDTLLITPEVNSIESYLSTKWDI